MDKKKRDLLVFGYGLPLILFFLSGASYLKRGLMVFNLILFVLAVIVLLITIFNKKLLKAIYFRWMKVAHFIGGVVTNIILIIFFYCVLSPVGLFLRLIRKDFMSRKIDRNADSYWNIEEDVPFNKEHCLRQF